MLHVIFREVLTWLLEDWSIDYTSISTARSAARVLCSCREFASIYCCRWALSQLRIELLELRVSRMERLLSFTVTPAGERDPLPLQSVNLEHLMRIDRIELWRQLMGSLRQFPEGNLREQHYSLLLAYSRFTEQPRYW